MFLDALRYDPKDKDARLEARRLAARASGRVRSEQVAQTQAAR
jgi:hypothetical protein